MNKARLGIDEVELLEGEHLDSTLSLRHGLGNEIQEDDSDLLLLTNRRIFQFTGGSDGREVAVAELADVRAGSLKLGARRTVTLVWGVVGIIGGLVLYSVVMSSFDNRFLAIALALLSGFLGLYLLFDYWSSHEEIVLTLRAGGFDMRGRVQGKGVWADANAFLNRVFVLKNAGLHEVAEVAEETTPTYGVADVEQPPTGSGTGPSPDDTQEEEGISVGQPAVEDAVTEDVVESQSPETSGAIEEEARTMKQCGHCGYEFLPKVEYPERCSQCQKPWPLGEPLTWSGADASTEATRSQDLEPRPGPTLTDAPPSEGDSQRPQS